MTCTMGQVGRWYESEGSGWHTRWFCCHSEGHRSQNWAKMNCMKFNKVKCSCRNNIIHQDIAWGQPARNQLGREGPGFSGGQWDGRVPAMWNYIKEGHQHLGLHYYKPCQYIQGVGPSSLLTSAETKPSVQCPVLGFPVHERPGCSAVSPVNDTKIVKRLESLQMRRGWESWSVEPGEEKARGRFLSKNHRMAEVGRDLWRLFSLISLPSRIT